MLGSLSHHTNILNAGDTLVPNITVVLGGFLPAKASFMVDPGLGCTASLTLYLPTAVPQDNWATEE